jgi:DNA-binding transcriptional MerR regulator
MRIGELAGAVGITTRAVRHYHRIGLRPEPPRQPYGYREYTLRDAVELARIRRLAELGLSLDEVRDVLADDAGKDLVDILAELDADLARQKYAPAQTATVYGLLFVCIVETVAIRLSVTPAQSAADLAVGSRQGLVLEKHDSTRCRATWWKGRA